MKGDNFPEVAEILRFFLKALDAYDESWSKGIERWIKNRDITNALKEELLASNHFLI